MGRTGDNGSTGSCRGSITSTRQFSANGSLPGNATTLAANGNQHGRLGSMQPWQEIGVHRDPSAPAVGERNFVQSGKMPAHVTGKMAPVAFRIWFPVRSSASHQKATVVVEPPVPDHPARVGENLAVWKQRPAQMPGDRCRGDLQRVQGYDGLRQARHEGIGVGVGRHQNGLGAHSWLRSPSWRATRVRSASSETTRAPV